MHVEQSNDILNTLRLSLTESPAPDEFILQTSLNEAWFSNVLAWLLNPRGSHGLGVNFCMDFVSAIARKRVDPAAKPQYVRRATFLKHGKGGPGVGSTGFSFENATALREYYLSKAIPPRQGRNSRFCDVVFLDLDSHDSFFLAIENKLFTSDHSGQLQEYRETIDDKYSRAAVRELVYLTLRGDPPVAGGSQEDEQCHWIRMSWVQDILGMEALTSTPSERVAPVVVELIDLLRWLADMTDLERFPISFRVALKRLLLRAAAECLYEELVRLDKPEGGQWKLEEPTQVSERISYTVRTAAYLTIELTPGLNVTVQGRQYAGKADFEKIVVPFGAHADQVINLLDIAARDVYHRFFGTPSAHLGTARRLRVTGTEKELQHRPLFEFLSRHRHALKPMLLQSAAVRAQVGVRDEEGDVPSVVETRRRLTVILRDVRN